MTNPLVIGAEGARDRRSSQGADAPTFWRTAHDNYMSHFSAIQTQLVNKEALVTGLMGLLAEKGLAIPVEVHDQPVALVSQYDRRDEAFAQVILRRQPLEGLLDVGFLWNETQGHFDAQIDAWDFSRHQLGKTFRNVQNFLDSVQLAHNRAFVEIQYPRDLWEHQTIQLEDGTIQTTLTQKVNLAMADNF